MAIVFKPEIAFIMYLVAIILSLLPKKLFSNMLLSVFDFVAVGSGEIARKRYFDGIAIFLISSIIYFLIYFFRDYFIQIGSILPTNRLPFIANSIVIIGTLFFVIFYSIHRGYEIEKEKLDRKHNAFINKINKQLEELSKNTGRPISPISSSYELRDDRPFTNAIGETEEESARRDQEWLEEVMETQRRQVELDNQEELNQRQYDSFYN